MPFPPFFAQRQGNYLRWRNSFCLLSVEEARTGQRGGQGWDFLLFRGEAYTLTTENGKSWLRSCILLPVLKGLPLQKGHDNTAQLSSQLCLHSFPHQLTLPLTLPFINKALLVPPSPAFSYKNKIHSFYRNTRSLPGASWQPLLTSALLRSP